MTPADLLATIPACETCRWWKGGSCHRYPPSLNFKHGFSHSSHPSCWQFPATYPHSWCGEHAPVQELEQ